MKHPTPWFGPPTPPYAHSTPPPDLDKPAIPYTKGQRFTVLSHTPPPPLGRPYPNSRPLTPRETLAKMTQLEYCLAADPLGGEIKHQGSFSFTITRELAVRDGRGAQIVVVNDSLVAKIYDPLYYPPYFEDTSIRNDVVELAERHYSIEAAAYGELTGRFGGTIIPKYYGSWTCQVPVATASGITKRPVRLILIEWIDGVSMDKLDPNKLSEEAKSSIMVKAIEAEIAVNHHGVNQTDFSPRNVVVCYDDLGSLSRVVLIDFNTAILWRFATNPQDTDLRESSDLPVSPIVRYWPSGPLEFTCSGWIPRPPGEWLWKHWGDSPFYQPVTRGMERDPICPPPM